MEDELFFWLGLEVLVAGGEADALVGGGFATGAGDTLIDVDDFCWFGLVGFIGEAAEGDAVLGDAEEEWGTIED